MERIFPVITALTLALALLLSVFQILSRRREIWLMHCTGTSRGRAFGSLAAEQGGLVLLGLAAGLALCRWGGLLSAQGGILALIFAGLWLLGACVAAWVLTLRPTKASRDE